MCNLVTNLNNCFRESLLDHIYVTDPTINRSITTVKPCFSDHLRNIIVRIEFSSLVFINISNGHILQEAIHQLRLRHLIDPMLYVSFVFWGTLVKT